MSINSLGDRHQRYKSERNIDEGKKLKNKLNVNLLLGILLVITLTSFSSALPGISLYLDQTAATTSSGVGGAVVTANVSVPEAYASGGVSNYTCFLYAKSSSTGNSSNVLLGFAGNNSAGGLINMTNFTFNSNAIEDASDYIFNATCVNDTAWFNETIVTSILVDNTVPTAPTSLSPAASSTDDDGTVTFSSTVTGSRTTACTLYFTGINPGESSYSMTHSGSTCTSSSLNLPEQTFEYYIQASDGTNTTNSANTRFEVSIDTPSNYLFQKEAEKKKTLSIVDNALASGSARWIIGIITVIVVVALIARRK